MSKAYYAQKLSADRLDRVYAIAGPRVRQYLQAEMDYVRATTFSPEDFAGLAERLGVEAEIYEVDSSSVFCKILRF